ncbi:MAG: ferritin-like protein [Crocinitomicaceae bacterium]
MRQKLIKKKITDSPKKSVAKGLEAMGAELEKMAGAKLAADSTNEALHQLLFDRNIGKDQWTAGLKEHSKTLVNTLLNDDFEGFEMYLNSHLKHFAESKEASEQIGKSGLMQIDQKAFLQEFLQLAVLIEHSTIPPYLTAMYSIKDGTNALAGGIIRSVVIEEMLHMIMVCNVLNALDIVPSVNKPQNFPSYPMQLPLNVDFYVNLEKFSTNSLATFIAIESPSSPSVDAPGSDTERNRQAAEALRTVEEASDFWTSENLNDFLTKNVETIGEFYDVLFFFILVFQVIDYYKKNGKLPTSFDDINTGGLFTGDPSLQIGPEQYYGSGGKLYTVTSLTGVMDVFKEIKGQGEGADDSIFDVDAAQFTEGMELAHYFRFKEIFHERQYIPGDYSAFTDKEGRMPVITPPQGPDLKVDWSAVYPMKQNVKLSDFEGNPDLYAQGVEFNKTYKKLLDAVQVAVEGKPEEIERSVMYMYALRDMAVELMKQPLTATENAGPTFEYPSN